MPKPIIKSLLFFLVCSSLVLTACSQCDSAGGFIPAISHKTIAVGQSAVTIRQLVFETESSFVLLQLHSNEITAADAASEFSYRWGVPFVQIMNGAERLVTFSLRGKSFQFDPNRIFSEEGIKKTLLLSGRYTAGAAEEVKRFRDSLLFLLQADKAIVAVHNNTDGKFNIQQYKDRNIGQVHVNIEQDTDDFFLTNDDEIFFLLKEENYNVILEDASQMEDDGSLSMYCERNGIRYINVEAEHGHKQQQIAMLEVVNRILK